MKNTKTFTQKYYYICDTLVVYIIYIVYICSEQLKTIIMKLSEVLNPENKFFVYEGKDLKAAQPTFNGAMRYFKEGRKMYNGTPTRHKTDVTPIAYKINKWNDK